MSTAISRITRALFLNGAASPINPASQELKELTFEDLVSMLISWAALNINLGITIPTNPTDELDNPPDTDLVIAYQLAVLSAPTFKIDAPYPVKVQAKQLYNNLLTTYAPHPLPEWTDTLPTGSGNMRGTKPRVYFPTPEGLTDSAGVPLVGGNGS
ncbi:MAG: packaged DNA stabilization gp4 family protein [Nitrosomonadaceae bacterium]